MKNAYLVGRGEPAQRLRRHLAKLVEAHRRPREARPQRLALQQLHRQKRDRRRVGGLVHPEVEHAAHVWMGHPARERHLRAHRTLATPGSRRPSAMHLSATSVPSVRSSAAKT